MRATHRCVGWPVPVMMWTSAREDHPPLISPSHLTDLSLLQCLLLEAFVILLPRQFFLEETCDLSILSVSCFGGFFVYRLLGHGAGNEETPINSPEDRQPRHSL